MSIVSETLKTFLPSKRKTTPSGWVSFHAPCCVHNGESPDNRQRGGIIEEGDTVSYHCFNCGYKASWQPGRHISYKLRQLLVWIGTPDSEINKLSLEVLKINEGAPTSGFLAELPSFGSVLLPDNAFLITNESKNDGVHLAKVKHYMASRHLETDRDYYWSPTLTYRDRLIIPFYFEKRIVGWTARTATADKNPKYLTESQPGYLFNLDNQDVNKAFCIVAEGPVDAIHIDGVALLRAEINEQQIMLLKRLNKDIILLPDRDQAGKRIIEQAIENNWQVSMPDWDPTIKDAGDAVLQYGKLFTLYSIVSAAEQSPLKIRLKAKKWFGKPEFNKTTYKRQHT